MKHQTPFSHQLSDVAQRHEFQRLLAPVLRIFGLHKLHLATEIVNDVFENAAANLIFRLPGDLPAFLLELAKKKALEAARQPGGAQSFSMEISLALEAGQMLEALFDKIFTEKELPESRLGLLFACCHPALPVDLRHALILKTHCTFSEKDIQHLRPLADLAIFDELANAKDLILQNAVQVSVPSARTFSPRFEEVLHTLWLLFFEGFEHNQKTIFVCRGMCDQALRTAFSLLENPATCLPKTYGLLSVFCLLAARFDPRRGRSASLIFLEEKNRSKWNQSLIDRGVAYFEQAGMLDKTCEYQLFAQILMEHTLAPQVRFTNWFRLEELYLHLLKVNPQPKYHLQNAWVFSKSRSAGAALDYLFGTAGFSDWLLGDWQTSALVGEFHRQMKHPQEAVKFYRNAQNHAPTTALSRLLSKKILAVEQGKKRRRRKKIKW
ncbi:MAG: DUF6596 domain-containing protein [Bacteroidota bacterium]